MLQLFPSPVRNESTEISPAGSLPEVPLLICPPPLPPEDIVVVNNSNENQQAPQHEARAAAASDEPKSEDDEQSGSDSDEPSLTQPRASFSQSVRDLPTKRNRIQSSWYN